MVNSYLQYMYIYVYTYMYVYTLAPKKLTELILGKYCWLRFLCIAREINSEIIIPGYGLFYFRAHLLHIVFFCCYFVRRKNQLILVQSAQINLFCLVSVKIN